MTPYDDKPPYLCIFGSQRVHIAVTEGYTHIDAFLLENPNYGILVGRSLEYSICPEETST